MGSRYGVVMSHSVLSLGKGAPGARSGSSSAALGPTTAGLFASWAVISVGALTVRWIRSAEGGDPELSQSVPSVAGAISWSNHTRAIASYLRSIWFLESSGENEREEERQGQVPLLLGEIWRRYQTGRLGELRFYLPRVGLPSPMVSVRFMYLAEPIPVPLIMNFSPSLSFLSAS